MVVEREISAWNHIIKEFSQRKQVENALQAFHQIQVQGLLPSKATFVCLLSSFTCQTYTYHAKRMYCIIVNSSFDSDVVVGSSLVNMFKNCGHMNDCRRIFDAMPSRNVVTWTMMISSCVAYDDAIHLFNQMLLDGIFPNKVTLMSLFRVCSSLDDGKRIHSLLLECGDDVDVVVCSCIISMYGRCGSLKDARETFDKTKEKNVVLLTSMVSVYADHGCGKEALQIYHHMSQQGFLANKITYSSLLSACEGYDTLASGNLIHATIMHFDFNLDVFLETALVSMYGKCGSLNDVSNMFDSMQQRNTVSWNALLAAYKNGGKCVEVQQLYYQMLHEGSLPSKASYLILLNALGNLRAQTEGRRLHATIIQSIECLSDVEVHNSLVNMYAKCGSLHDAREVFDAIYNRSMVSWNTIITACTDHMETEIAIQLFIDMWQEGFVPNEITLTSILVVCGHKASLEAGRILYACLVEENLTVDSALVSSLINMYGKCGDINDALHVFLNTPQRDVNLWTSIIIAYAQDGEGWKAIQFFNLMQYEGVPPNEVTFVTVLLACSHAGLVTEGLHCVSLITHCGIKLVDEHMLCLIDLLGRAGQIDEAELLLNYLSHEAMVIALVMLLSFFKHVTDVVQGQRVAKMLVELDPNNAAAYVLLSNMYMADDRTL